MNMYGSLLSPGINICKQKTLYCINEWMGWMVLYSIAVLEAQTGMVTALIRDGLVAEDRGDSVVITRGERLDLFEGAYDLFIVSEPNLKIHGDCPEISCRALLAPGDAPPQALGGISSKWVVSYGLSGKDSITVSSLERDTAVLALQRELMTLGEEVVERQEIPVCVPDGLDSQGIMAVYGGLLIMGIMP